MNTEPDNDRSHRPTPAENRPLIVATFLCFVVLFGLSLWSRRRFFMEVANWIGIDLSERGAIGLVVGLTVFLAAVFVYFVNHHPDR